jgi:3-oxoacyl-[acyl-carrier-protein] synthase-3
MNMNSEVKKIEYVLPENVLTNEQLNQDFPEWNSHKIADKVGVKKRHIAAINETATDLAILAAEKLFKSIDRNNIDFLLYCTQSPDYILPTSACIIQDRLGLNRSIGALDFNLGCSGFIYGLSLSKGLIKAGIAKNVLLITSETYSKHIHKLDKGNRSIFGDGAAATLISQSEFEKIGNFEFGTDGKGFDNLIIKNGGARNKYQESSEDIIDDSGYVRNDNFLYMNGPEIFNFTIQAIPPLVEQTLKKNNLTIENINDIVFHQANKFMLDYLRKKLKVPEEKFYQNMLETGNTVSATIPIALKDCFENKIINEGDKVLLAGFGVGYSWGGTIIEI